MNKIKLGQFEGRNVYLPDGKLEDMAKKDPCGYFKRLRGAYEILLHPCDFYGSKEDNKVTVASHFGEIEIKRKNGRFPWYIERVTFRKLEDF